jgi:hypothetical protein
MSDMMTVAQLPGMSNVIAPSLFLLLEPRDEAQLHDIIVEPARLAGRTIADDVARSLVEIVIRGNLPLRELQERIAAMWDDLT